RFGLVGQDHAHEQRERSWSAVRLGGGKAIDVAASGDVLVGREGEGNLQKARPGDPAWGGQPLGQRECWAVGQEGPELRFALRVEPIVMAGLPGRRRSCLEQRVYACEGQVAQ